MKNPKLPSRSVKVVDAGGHEIDSFKFEPSSLTRKEIRREFDTFVGPFMKNSGYTAMSADLETKRFSYQWKRSIESGWVIMTICVTHDRWIDVYFTSWLDSIEILAAPFRRAFSPTGLSEPHTYQFGAEDVFPGWRKEFTALEPLQAALRNLLTPTVFELVDDRTDLSWFERHLNEAARDHLTIGTDLDASLEYWKVVTAVIAALLEQREDVSDLARLYLAYFERRAHAALARVGDPQTVGSEGVARQARWCVAGCAALARFVEHPAPPNIEHAERLVAAELAELVAQSVDELEFGALVRHPKFGLGEVMHVDNSTEQCRVRVRFADTDKPERVLLARFVVPPAKL